MEDQQQMQGNALSAPLDRGVYSRRSLIARLLALGGASLAVEACGGQGSSAVAPRIRSLDPPAARGSQRPINIRSTVLDASTNQSIPFAHVSYNKQVVSADSSGSFAFQSVPPGQALSVVATGYRRYAGSWKLGQGQVKLTPFQAHGIYMPFAGLTNPAILAAIDRDTTNTEINAVVIEIKTDDGNVAPEMATPAAQDARAVAGDDGLLKAFIQKMQARNIYTIGRFVVFRDPTLATAHPELALRFQNGQPYEDEQGQKWIDAFRPETWQYNLDIAEKAAQLGIDEIQFDYIRFPGAISPLQYGEPMTEDNRVAALSGFLKSAEERLRPYGVAIAIDSFGQTTIATDDTGIGQDIVALGQYLDYYCPMVYPSTWANGSFDVPYPAADPHTIVLKSVQSAIQRLSGIPTVRVRPWLQAFDDYNARQVTYTPDMVNTQKDAANQTGAVGWMLWHPISHYDAGVIGPASSASAAQTGH